MSWDQAVAQAKIVPYDTLIRDNAQYVGQLVRFPRAIVDTVNDDGSPSYLTVNPPAFLWDTIVNHCACSARQRPGDIVDVVARIDGLQSTAISEPIPAIDIEALKWNGETQ